MLGIYHQCNNVQMFCELLKKRQLCTPWISLLEQKNHLHTYPPQSCYYRATGEGGSLICWSRLWYGPIPNTALASDLNSVPSRNKEKIIKGNCETWRGTWTHPHLPNRSDHKTIHGKSKLDSLFYCIHQLKGKYCSRLPCHSPKNYLLQNEPLGSLVKFTVIGDSEERWRLPTVWGITSFT